MTLSFAGRVSSIAEGVSQEIVNHKVIFPARGFRVRITKSAGKITSGVHMVINVIECYSNQL
jgi:hypothetical protein